MKQKAREEGNICTICNRLDRSMHRLWGTAWSATAIVEVRNMRWLTAGLQLQPIYVNERLQSSLVLHSSLWRLLCLKPKIGDILPRIGEPSANKTYLILLWTWTLWCRYPNVQAHHTKCRSGWAWTFKHLHDFRAMSQWQCSNKCIS